MLKIIIYDTMGKKIGKKWYLSKTVQSGVAIAIVGILQAYGVPMPYINAIYSVLAGYGLYGVRDAIDKLE